jgi:hypothetical protein
MLRMRHFRIVTFRKCAIVPGPTQSATAPVPCAPGIYIAGNLIRGVLVGVSPSDPLTLLAVALGLLLVTLAACYVPARRALGIEPATLLRQE